MCFLKQDKLNWLKYKLIGLLKQGIVEMDLNTHLGTELQLWSSEIFFSILKGSNYDHLTEPISDCCHFYQVSGLMLKCM